MELREIIKKLIISYPIIYGCTMMAAFVCCLVFHPDAVFGIDYLGKALVFALAGDLPSLVFCSKRELSHGQADHTSAHAGGCAFIIRLVPEIL